MALGEVRTIARGDDDAGSGCDADQLLYVVLVVAEVPPLPLAFPQRDKGKHFGSVSDNHCTSRMDTTKDE